MQQFSLVFLRLVGVNLLVYLKTWVIIILNVLRRNVTKLRKKNQVYFQYNWVQHY